MFALTWWAVQGSNLRPCRVKAGNADKSEQFRTSEVMATVALSKVETRERLMLRREPYWHRIEAGGYVVLRKMVEGTAGTWVARCRDADAGKQQHRALGDFGVLPAHARIDSAAKAARHWFVHLGRGGSTGAITALAPQLSGVSSPATHALRSSSSYLLSIRSCMRQRW